MGDHQNRRSRSIMSGPPHSRKATFQGTLAALEIVELAQPGYWNRYQQALLRGLKRRASQRGCVVEVFRVRSGTRSLRQLDSVLQTRGIRGLVILPVWSPPDLSALDWSRYVGIYLDCLIERPALASIHPDRFGSMLALLARLAELGYRRPGLVLVGEEDQRVLHEWEGALLASQFTGPGAAVPVLKLGAVDRQRLFTHWFRRHEPDVILGLDAEVISWITLSGGAVPKRQGFVNLNLLGSSVPCAGSDLQPEVIGAGAIDLLTLRLARHERGVPAIASATAIPARWVDGPTLVDRRFCPALPCSGHELARRHPRRWACSV
jgi:LacI family transcriptional regulator